MKIPVFIFSYNRGEFLENAISSVEECFPYSEIFVMDDNSDDPVTIQILDRISSHFEVVRTASDAYVVSTGGLHSNMNRALNLAESMGARNVLFLQDDQQIVRQVSETELSKIVKFFEEPHSSFVLQTCFSKKGRAHLDQLKDIGEFLYRPVEVKIRSPSRMISYCDTGIFNIPRLREKVGRLLDGEPTNEVQANRLNLRLGFMPTPFMHYLPFPISYKRKRRSLTVRLADHLSGAGVHRIRIMSEAEVAALRSRKNRVLPCAEDWLVAPTAPISDVWSLTGGISNMVARGGWRKRIAKLYLSFAS